MRLFIRRLLITIGILIAAAFGAHLAATLSGDTRATAEQEAALPAVE